MSKGEKTRPQSIIDDLAEEYRADALKRLDWISLALAGPGRAEDGAGIIDGECLDGIKMHAHSIKGTSGTFGFSGLSVIAHAMDDYLNRMPSSEGSHFAGDLERFTRLMKTIVSADNIVTEDTARQMLSALHLDARGDSGEKVKKGRTTALLIMEQGGVRETISRTLEILGVDVVIAHDGVEAIELATLQHPDIIVLALYSERLSAPEVIQVFAEINATSTAPAIVLTPARDDDRTSGLIGALPPGVHTLRQDETLIRNLSEKLVTLGIISP